MPDAQLEAVQLDQFMHVGANSDAFPLHFGSLSLPLF